MAGIELSAGMEGLRLLGQERLAGESPVALTREEANLAHAYHAGFPMYRATPLRSLGELARRLRVGAILVKDESGRFGLNAFKVLGASYAVGRWVAQSPGIRRDRLSYALLTSPDTLRRLGDLTLVTASDGNHGRGVAWTAARLKLRSVVYLPRGSAPAVLQNIAREGAQVLVADGNYDEAVHLAAEHARKLGCLLVQDTAWDGYEEILGFIMQGYLTLARELEDQLAGPGQAPTHVFLQAGVGTLAAGLAGYYQGLPGNAGSPLVTVVEPAAVNCFYRSAAAGARTCVTGDYASIMAGLACGAPSTTAYRILRQAADCFLSIPDQLAAYGMRVLGNPLGEDPRVISGESGAACLGAVASILSNPALGDFREALKITPQSRLLFISTEGDTNPGRYRDIVWGGAWPLTDGDIAGSHAREGDQG